MNHTIRIPEIKTTALPSNTTKQTKPLHNRVPNTTAAGMRSTIRRGLWAFDRIRAVLPCIRPWGLFHRGNRIPTITGGGRGTSNRRGTDILPQGPSLLSLDGELAVAVVRFGGCIPRRTSGGLFLVLLVHVVGRDASRGDGQ